MDKGTIRKKDNIKSLEMAHTIREFHHKSLWEEEKHFTWLISLLLTAQIILYMSNDLCNQNKFYFILILSITGNLICCMAFRILRREGYYFHKALSKFV